MLCLIFLISFFYLAGNLSHPSPPSLPALPSGPFSHLLIHLGWDGLGVKGKGKGGGPYLESKVEIGSYKYRALNIPMLAYRASDMCSLLFLPLTPLRMRKHYLRLYAMKGAHCYGLI